jgi:DNA (cytosine-5)-methyltransferase 1
VPTRANIRRFVDLTAFDDDIKEENTAPAPRTPSSLRGKKLTITAWTELKNVRTDGQLLRRGATVELLRYDGALDRPHFLHIVKVLRHPETGEVRLCGHPIRRNIGTRYLPQKTNEVYLDIEENLEDPRHYYEQGTIQVQLSDVFRLRHVTFTHQSWPELSYVLKDLRKRDRNDPAYREYKERAKNEEDLVCRFVIIRRFLTAAQQKTNRMDETSVRRLYEDESPLTPLSSWKVKSKPNTMHEKRQRLARPSKRMLYTYGSGFSGWGGDSQGAKRAGLRVKLAFDEWLSACNAFQRNHHHANVYNQSAHSVYQLERGAFELVDHLHLSPPCQYWSSAHTIAGKDDNKNIASLFCVEDILKKFNPRTHSQEQTSAILSHHGIVFGYLIHMIVSAGYNVRWKIAKFEQYGLSSSRKRLVIFAAK